MGADFSSIDPAALSYVDTDYSKAYLRHLIKSDEILGLQICSIHNLSFLFVVGERSPGNIFRKEIS